MRTKIAIIGAGSVGFTRTFVRDILCISELQDCYFHLMDISDENLTMAVNLTRKFVADHEYRAQIDGTTQLKEAIADAQFVIVVFRIGGLDAFALDIEIPLKYGVDQCVGDTMGPGGVFYHLRNYPELKKIAEAVTEVGAPGCWVLNYANPMSMNTWALRKTGFTNILGLCHGVQGSHELIARALKVDWRDLDFTAAGLNHMTWFIKAEHKGKSVLKDILPAMEQDPEIAANEKARMDVLRHFGYWSTESNGHLSEYLPWYRKREDLKAKYASPKEWWETGKYLAVCRESQHEYQEKYPKWINGEEPVAAGERSREHASYIIEGLVTGRPYRGHFIVENTGLIPNLQTGCSIEIPCYVDRNGIQPTYIGELPKPCAALCASNVAVQDLASDGAITGNKEYIHQAVLLDPLTAAVLGTDEIHNLVEEMFEQLAPWLPQF
jgi:alpha-galactosidase